MKKYTYLILLLPFLFGSSYYVASDGSGNFTNITQLQSSILNGTILPGDNILFKKGNSNFGNWNCFNLSGAENNPITISSYGSGDKPILSYFHTNNGTNYINVQNLQFYSVQNSSHTIYFNGSHDINFNNNTLISNGNTSDNAGWGNMISSGGLVSPTYNISIIDNTIDAEQLNGGINLFGDTNGLYNILIENNTVSNAVEIGIQTMGTIDAENVYNITIRNNKIYDTVHESVVVDRVVAHGINIGFDCFEVLVENNYAGGNEKFGIVLDGGVRNTTVKNNVCYNNGNSIGVQGVYEGVKNIKLYQNSLISGAVTGWSGFIFDMASPLICENIDIKNNIIICAGATAGDPDYYQNNATFINITNDNNLYFEAFDPHGPRFFLRNIGDYHFATWQATGQDLHSIVSDPLINSTGFPQTNSPAIDAGTDVGVTTDYRGVSRSALYFDDAPDIGAYERKKRQPAYTRQGASEWNATITAYRVSQ